MEKNILKKIEQLKKELAEARKTYADDYLNVFYIAPIKDNQA